MDASIIVAIISSSATICAVVITSISSASRTKFQIEQMMSELKAISDKVEKHNGFDRRIVALETKIEMLENDGK